MIFWLGVLFGTLFAVLGYKRGFYETLALLFNIVISIYLGIFLAPFIVSNVPGAGDLPLSKLLAVVSTTAAAFVILHGITYIYFTCQFTLTFPRLLDTLGAGGLGFAVGFLLWSFATLLVCMSPVSQNAIFRQFGFDTEARQSGLSSLSWWSDRVHRITAIEYEPNSVNDRINWLMQNTPKETPKKTAPSDANSPGQTKVKEPAAKKSVNP